jgi:hypothetical protein
MGWSKERTKYLTDNWTKLSAKAIAEELGLTESAVRGKAYRLGL